MKEFKWKKTNKLVIGEEFIVEDEDHDINSEDEEFYGRKTVRGSTTIIKNQLPSEINEELKNYKK